MRGCAGVGVGVDVAVAVMAVRSFGCACVWRASEERERLIHALIFSWFDFSKAPG